MSKKIIIIGGGLAGLTAGIYGAKANYDVEIYEKNNIVGGECTGWDRKGYHIDNCLHWMMGTNEGTDLYDIWKTVGAIGDNVKIGANAVVLKNVDKNLTVVGIPGHEKRKN